MIFLIDFVIAFKLIVFVKTFDNFELVSSQKLTATVLYLYSFYSRQHAIPSVGCCQMLLSFAIKRIFYYYPNEINLLLRKLQKLHFLHSLP